MSKKYYKRSPSVDRGMIVSLVIIMVTTLGTTIPLYIHSESQSNERHKETSAQLRAIQEEMKDFHGRLCAIEERNKKCL